MTNIFDYAISIEKEGYRFYKELAEKTEHKGLKAIFTMLMNDEKDHEKLFTDLKAEEQFDHEDTDILEEAYAVFKESADSGTFMEGINKSSIEAYKHALDIEKKVAEYFKSKAGETDDPQQKKILLRLAAEEEKHVFLIENIIEFVSRPETWIENAEFGHLRNY